MPPANLPFLTQVSKQPGNREREGRSKRGRCSLGGRTTGHCSGQVSLWLSTCQLSPLCQGNQGRRETAPSWRSSSPRGIRSYVDRTFDPAASMEMWTESVKQVQRENCRMGTESGLATVTVIIVEWGQRVV